VLAVAERTDQPRGAKHPAVRSQEKLALMLASSRIRVGGRSPNTAVQRSRLVAIRQSVIVPSSAVMNN
jgi:hypothetical protein